MKMKGTIALAVLLASADEALKALIRTQPQGAVLFSMPPILEITHRANTGAAFSLLSGNPLLVTLLSAALLAALCAVMLRALCPTRASRIALAFVIGGGMGNLIDRLAFGEVTDYVRLLFIRFPVFNLADMCITGGAAALILLAMTGRLEIQAADAADTQLPRTKEKAENSHE